MARNKPLPCPICGEDLRGVAGWIKCPRHSYMCIKHCEKCSHYDRATTPPTCAFGLDQKTPQQIEAEKNIERVYIEYQNAIKKSGLLMPEILKGVQKGEELTGLFLKAVEAISLQTGNTAFYSIIEHILEERGEINAERNNGSQ